MNLPEHLHHRASEILAMEADAADKKRLWAVIYNLIPYPHNGGWMVGTVDIQGFGESPVDAINNFEHKMYLKTKS